MSPSTANTSPIFTKPIESFMNGAPTITTPELTNMNTDMYTERFTRSCSSAAISGMSARYGHSTAVNRNQNAPMTTHK